MAREVGRRGADDQLQREQAPRDHAVLRARADAEADVDAVLHPVADAVVQLHVGLDLRVAAAELVEHRPEHRQHDRARGRRCAAARRSLRFAAGAVQRPLQRRQRRLRRLQELLALFGQAQAARGAVKQPHAQVRFELRQRLAGRLRRDALRGRGLAQAAQLGRLDEGGDGAQFVEGHGRT